MDLSAQPEEEIQLLGVTPAAGSIGTCRYKLKPKNTEDFQRFLDVVKAHDIGYFFYIGGNDSMDTAHKAASSPARRGWTCRGWRTEDHCQRRGRLRVSN
jgi:6-phosphofructokinase 1